MKTEEKFVVMDALELSVPEIEQYLQQMQKICPLPLLCMDAAENMSISRQADAGLEICGIVSGKYVWSLKYLRQSKNWHQGNAYARSCRIGKLPAMLPLFETMKQLDVLKFNRTVGLLKCCGTDADEMVAGSYLPSESAGEYDYPWCYLDCWGKIINDGWSSKENSRRDLIRMVALLPADLLFETV